MGSMSKIRVQSDPVKRLGKAGPAAPELDLLRAATLPVGQATVAWNRWIADNDIDLVPRRSIEILPSVSANLPSSVLGLEADRMSGIRRRVWTQNQLMSLSLGDALARLGEANITAVLAKGAALKDTVYPELGTRAMADSDVLIAEGQFDEALNTLMRAGWRRISPETGPYFHAVALANELGHQMDIHRWVAFPRFTAIPDSSWIARSVPHELGGCRIRRLDNADELVLATLHGPLIPGPSITRWPLDVFHIARSAAVDDPSLWDRVVLSAEELEVGPVTAEMLELCASELEAIIPATAIHRLRAGKLNRGLAQHWALCRHGISPAWRIRRYRRVQLAQGERPTITGYARARHHDITARGVGKVVAGRLRRARQLVENRPGKLHH
jgi:hypothetical protein